MIINEEVSSILRHRKQKIFRRTLDNQLENGTLPLLSHFLVVVNQKGFISFHACLTNQNLGAWD